MPHAPERLSQGPGVLEPVGRVFGQQASDDALQARGEPVRGAPLRQARHGRVQVLAHDGVSLRGVEGQLAGEQLEQDHAQGVEVAPRVQCAPRRLLGRHVLGGPLDHALGRELGGLAPRALLELGDPEVDDLHVVPVPPLRGEEDVLGLEVPVEDALSVDGLQGAAELLGDEDGPVGGEGAVSGEGLGQRHALDELQDEEQDVLGGLPHVQGRGHVGVNHLREDRRLPKEPGHGLGLGAPLGVQHLHGDVASRLAVQGAVDLADGSKGEAPLQQVARPQHLAAPVRTGFGRVGCGQVDGGLWGRRSWRAHVSQAHVLRRPRDRQHGEDTTSARGPASTTALASEAAVASAPASASATASAAASASASAPASATASAAASAPASAAASAPASAAASAPASATASVAASAPASAPASATASVAASAPASAPASARFRARFRSRFRSRFRARLRNRFRARLRARFRALPRPPPLLRALPLSPPVPLLRALPLPRPGTGARPSIPRCAPHQKNYAPRP